MKKGNNLKIFFTIAIVEMIIVSIFLGYYVYQIISQSERLHKETVVLQQKTELAKVANNLEDNVNELNNKIDLFENKFFNDQSFMEFLKGLNATASAYGLSVRRITFNRMKMIANVNPPIMELPISLSISGNSYDGLTKFIAYIERQQFSIIPETLSVTLISGRNKSIKSGVTEIRISFSVFIETQNKTNWSYRSGQK